MAIRVWKHAAGAAPALVSVTLHAAVLGVTALIAWPVEPSEVAGGDSIVVGETVAVASLAPFEAPRPAPEPEQNAAPLDDAPVAAPAPVSLVPIGDGLKRIMVLSTLFGDASTELARYA